MAIKTINKSQFQIDSEINITDTTGNGYESWADGLAEWNKLESVFVHRPGIETSLASLDFKTNLFLDVFYLDKAQQQHDDLCTTLEDEGISVIRSADLVDYLEPRDLKKFVNFNERFSEQDRDELLQNYIEDHKQLDILLIQPEISRVGEEGLETSNNFTLTSPLGNFFYARDPIFQTGEDTFVLSNLKYKVRRAETEITELLFQKIPMYDDTLSPQILYKIPKDETIEGGELYPLGDTMIAGVESQRTSIGSALNLMRNNAVGHSNIGIPISPVKTLEEMHIDTWFNIIDEDLFVASSRFLNQGIDFLLYERDEDRGKYILNQEITDFKDYLINYRDMEMIGLNDAEQRDLMSNGLTIDRRKYVMIDGKSSSQSFKHRLDDYGVDFIPVELDELTDGLGGAHCMTQPVKRQLDSKYIVNQ